MAPSLAALLHGVAANHPARCALHWQDPGAPEQAPTSLSYAQLRDRSAALAVELRSRHGIGPGDRVAWLGLNHPTTLLLLFALARLGALLVPLNHRLAPAEWRQALNDCRPRLLVHDAGFSGQARVLDRSAAAPRLLAAEDLVITGSINGREAPPPGPAWDQPALLVYTSGTTGQPRAAIHSKGNLLANMGIAAQTQALNADDTVLTVLPLFHVGGLCIQTLPALSVGATVLLHARFDAGATLATIETGRPTLTLQVPATLKALCENPRWASTDLSSLRAVWAGSSLLPNGPLAAFHARGVPVCNVYGSTETGPFSIALPPEHATDHAGSCGWPAPGVDVKLRDATGGEVPPGEVGELCIRGPNVARRYWSDTPILDPAGYFHSGDLAQQAADGSYRIVGRAKDMIISGGENIYPAEIENALLAHPLVSECCVIGQADPHWGEVAVAVVVLQPGTTTSGDWAVPLQAHLRDRLARYKWPRHWVQLDALPKTALGKVRKAELRKRLSV